MAQPRCPCGIRRLTPNRPQGRVPRRQPLGNGLRQQHYGEDQGQIQGARDNAPSGPMTEKDPANCQSANSPSTSAVSSRWLPVGPRGGQSSYAMDGPAA
jgi:hypothetical protein